MIYIVEKSLDYYADNGYRAIYASRTLEGAQVAVANFIKYNDDEEIYSSGYDEAMDDIVDSAKKLGGYVDLMLIHWVVANDIKTYQAIEQAITLGLVKSVGISNYYGNDLGRIITNAKILPVLNQVECNIIQQQRDLQQISCSVLGSGLQPDKRYGYNRMSGSVYIRRRVA